MDKTKSKLKTALPFDFVATKKDIINAVLSVLGFFIGRVVVFGSVNPVALAYITPFFMNGKSFYLCGLFITLGIFTCYNHFFSFKYLICIAILFSIQLIFKTKKNRNQSVYVQSAIVSGALALSGLLVAAITNGSFYLALMALMESILTFTFGIIFNFAIRRIQKSGAAERLSNEEFISISVLIAAAIAGCSDIFIGGFSFRYFSCFLVTLIVAYEGGAASGAACGTLLGALLHISGFEPASFVFTMSMAGIICGSFKNISKPLSAAGFVIGLVMTGIYAAYPLFTPEHLLSAIIALIVFFLPFVKLGLPSGSFPALKRNVEYQVKAAEIVTSQLNSYSRAFGKLSESFGRMSVRKTGLSKKDVNNIIDDTAARVCADCRNCDKCWSENFYASYRNIYSILSLFASEGSVSIETVPNEFKEQCVETEVFLTTLNRYYELCRQNLMWLNKIAESRELIAEQMRGVSLTINSLSEEFDSVLNFDGNLEKELLFEFEKSGIEVESVIVSENSHGMYEVSIIKKPCFGKNICNRKIIPIVSRIIGRKMRNSDNSEICPDGICRLALTEEPRFVFSHGVSRSSKNTSDESGDSYTFMELKNGRCLLALSDGMGSGSKARKESSVAIELLEELLESGFDKSIAVKLINSALILRNGDESFSTLDICTADLYSGETEFIKIGASSTFLLRNGEIDVIRSWTLPAGIIESPDIDISKRKLRDGDIIVMVTDGILDSDMYESDKERWIMRALAKLGEKTPSDIADYILREAKRNYGIEAKDDMTVLAVKVWEKEV